MSFLKTCLKVACSFLELLNVDATPLFFLFRSRLGCQVCLSKSLDGVVAKVPESVADARQSQDG